MHTGKNEDPPIVSQNSTLTSIVPDLNGRDKWQESLKRVVPAIVVLRVSACSAFDGESPGYGYATGFVVDKARGIILTNRHVVTPGPAVADAVFMNKEEVDLKTVYYDPVHDFGFVRYDPKAVKFLEVDEIALNPEGAKVGVEIRVVGNDSGEKLSILPGILARLDRAAPDYTSGGYRDFNTFYLAAASSTSGGSSGSPVLTVDGKAVALNCGAHAETAAAFYLPLTKVKRALELIQRGEKVKRGTIQTVLKHTAFDEARRLGLTAETEESLRKEFPEETGVLVVSQVIPKGPADEVLEPGDVVVRMNGEMITTFLPFEGYLDEHVGGEIEVEVQRGGRAVTAKIPVRDLHSITPSEYLDVSSGVLHPLSYQQARNYNLPVEGVYLAQAGYMMERAWVVSGCLITSIGSDPTPNLDACEAALAKHPDGARLSLRYKALSDRHRTKTAVITIDRKWFPMQRVRRNDADGLWHSTPSPTPPPRAPRRELTPPQTLDSVGDETAGDATGWMKPSNALGIASSLVMVSFDIPHLVDGVSGSYCIGVGVIVDIEFGLVVVDRTTVQVSIGDVMLTFNGSEEVAAWPIFVHPVQNFSVVQFDPSTVKGPFTAASLSWRELEDEDEDDNGGVTGATSLLSSPPPLRPGDVAEFHGLTSANAPVRQRTVVVKLERLSLASSSHPQYTAHSVEVLQFDQIASCLGGVFVALPRTAAAAFSSHSSALPPPTLPPSSASSSSSSPSSPVGSSFEAPRRGPVLIPHLPQPVISAFWHSFSFSGSDGRKHTMRGLPAPVVRRAIERIVRDLTKQREHARREGTAAETEQGEEAAFSREALKKEESNVDVEAASATGTLVATTQRAGGTELGREKDGAAVPAFEDESGGADHAEVQEDIPQAADKSAAGTNREGVEVGGSEARCHDGASSPGTRSGIGLDKAKESLGAAPCLPLQLVTVELSKARAGLGLSEAWCKRVEEKCRDRQKQVLEVRRCMVGTPAFSVIETGDIILALEGKLVTRFREVEVAVEDADGRPVRLTVLRQLEEKEITVTPSYLPTRETDRIFMWAGLMVQTPHLAVLQLGFLPKQGGGVYSSRWCYGSPAHKYDLGCTTWIVEVNGVPTPTLDAFLDAVKDIGDMSPARVKTVGLDSKVEVTTFRSDHHYWPTLELRRSEQGWTRKLHTGPRASSEPPAGGGGSAPASATPQPSEARSSTEAVSESGVSEVLGRTGSQGGKGSGGEGVVGRGGEGVESLRDGGVAAGS